MISQVSFRQILEEKMNTPRSSSGADPLFSLGADPAHLAFLVGTIPRKSDLITPKGRYAAPKTRPQRRPHALNEIQQSAFSFFKTWVHDLSEGFTANELRQAFRQIALRTHPDHGGTSQLFMDLKSHYHTLMTVLK